MIKKLEEELQAEQTAIRQLNTEISTLQEKLVKDGEVMSEPEKRRLQKEAEDKQIDYQFQVNKLQKEVNDRQQEILGRLRTAQRGGNPSGLPDSVAVFEELSQAMRDASICGLGQTASSAIESAIANLHLIRGGGAQ